MIPIKIAPFTFFNNKMMVRIRPNNANNEVWSVKVEISGSVDPVELIVARPPSNTD